MVKKKVCMIGGPGVGKTSLVRRFVEGIFGERYHTTLGVKIDRKTVQVGDRDVLLVLWDIAGVDELSSLSQAYLRGAAGFLLVADCARPETVELALRLQPSVRSTIGDTPHLLLLNKVDLVGERDASRERFGRLDVPTLETSAKTGAQVEDAFTRLASQLVGS